MDQPNSRRKFLLAGMATGAAGAAIVAAKIAPAPQGASVVENAPSGKGYQLSEHVRNYYRTTQV